MMSNGISMIFLARSSFQRNIYTFKINIRCNRLIQIKHHPHLLK
jgi:hypothetical protein